MKTRIRHWATGSTAIGLCLVLSGCAAFPKLRTGTTPALSVQDVTPTDMVQAASERPIVNESTLIDIPKSSVQAELDRMVEGARADLKQRGVKDADKAPIPEDLFRPQAEKRVRLGLVVAELVRANNLQAKPEQIKTHIDELSASYEKPEDVVRWYMSDRRRMAEVEAVVIENNVTDFVLSKAQVTDKAVSFDELMGQS